jgi:hypothetical protein
MFLKYSYDLDSVGLSVKIILKKNLNFILQVDILICWFSLLEKKSLRILWMQIV